MMNNNIYDGHKKRASAVPKPDCNKLFLTEPLITIVACIFFVKTEIKRLQGGCEVHPPAAMGHRGRSLNENSFKKRVCFGAISCQHDHAIRKANQELIKREEK
jgi:hypothetical protein